MSQPSFYANIPADVRYDKVLCANAKLLYGEITALANKEGFCWASNEYFAKLYGVDKNTISRWVSSLRAQGYIRVEIVDRVERKIFIADSRIREKDFEDLQKSGGGSTKKTNQDLQKDGHISTVNNTINNKEKEEARAPEIQIKQNITDPFIPKHDFDGSSMVFQVLTDNNIKKHHSPIQADPTHCNFIYGLLISDDKETELKERLLQYDYSWWGEQKKQPTAKNVFKSWDQLTPDKVPHWIREGHATEREWKNARSQQQEAEKEKARQQRTTSQSLEIYDPNTDPAMIAALEDFGSLLVKGVGNEQNI